MLNEEQLTLLAEPFYNRYRDINTKYLELIGQRINDIGKMSATDAHRITQMYNHGADINDIIRDISNATTKSEDDIRAIFETIAKDNYAFAETWAKANNMPYIPFAQNEQIQRSIEAMSRTTMGEMKNLTQNTAFAVWGKNGNVAPRFASNEGKIATSLHETYRRVTDEAVNELAMGTTNYYSAMRQTTKALADSGIQSVDYATGYCRRLDSAIRQNILWGVKNFNQECAKLVGEEFGADGYEISFHPNPRPTHEEMGGRQYIMGEPKVIDGVLYPSYEDEAEPLLDDYGCLHFAFPIICGVSVPTYGKDELADMKSHDHDKYEFEGKEYTKYEAKQAQRQIESEIRHQKDRANIAKASGDDELRRETQTKINQLTNKYKKLSDACDIPTQMQKARASGFRAVKEKSRLSIATSLNKNNYNSYKKYLQGVSNNNIVLNKRHKFILDKIPNRGDFVKLKLNQVDIKDLAALTSKTGDEFAIFTSKEYKYVFHGSSGKWFVDGDIENEILDNKLIWEGHSHPYIKDINPSQEDIDTLGRLTWQKESSIIDIEGNIGKFTSNPQDFYNLYLGVI